MFKKTIQLYVLLALSLFLFTSCNIKIHTEDTNGEDDFSVVYYTDQDIINPKRDISFGSVENVTGKEIYYKVSKFSGSRKLYTASNDIDVNVEINYTSGNLRVCKVENGEITDLFTKDGIIKDVHLSEGSYIVICGESAKFSIKISAK